MRSLSRKAQVQTLAPAIIALVLAAAILVFGLIILQELRDTEVISNTGVNSVVNETLTTVDEIGETVATAGTPAFANFVITQIVNVTNGDSISADNYTYTQAGVVSYNGSAAVGEGFNNTNWAVTYTYTGAETAYTTSNSTLAGLATFADFWEIIVLAIVISIVIGLLLIVFGGGRRQK